MAVKGKSIKGLQVFSLKQSKKIAAVHDLICEANGHRVSAFTVGKRGLFAEMRVVPFEQIKSIGEDAVVVESDTAIINVSHAGKEIQTMVRDNIYIIDTSVITEDGVELGKIADVYFDPKTGMVVEVEVTQGPIKDVSEGRKKIPGADIISVGRGSTVVHRDTDEKLAAKRGGLKGMMQQVQDTIVGPPEKASFKEVKKGR